MDISSITQSAIQLGVVASLLIAFVMYFFHVDREREKRLCRLTEKYDDKIREQFDGFYEREALLLSSSREHERILLTESTRREELLLKQGLEREKLLRDEMERNQTFFMRTMDEHSRTLKEISMNLIDLKNIIKTS